MSVPQDGHASAANASRLILEPVTAVMGILLDAAVLVAAAEEGEAVAHLQAIPVVVLVVPRVGVAEVAAAVVEETRMTAVAESAVAATGAVPVDRAHLPLLPAINGVTIT